MKLVIIQINTIKASILEKTSPILINCVLTKSEKRKFAVTVLPKVRIHIATAVKTVVIPSK